MGCSSWSSSRRPSSVPLEIATIAEIAVPGTALDLGEDRAQFLRLAVQPGELLLDVRHQRAERLQHAVLVDEGGAAVAHDLAAVDPDLAHRAARLGEDDLAHYAVERAEGGVAQVDGDDVGGPSRLAGRQGLAARRAAGAR